MTDQGTSGKQLGGWLADAGDAIVSVLFPAGCRLCERLLVRASRVPICEDCLASFTALPGRVCQICGSPPETSFVTISGPPEATNTMEADPPVCAACRVRTYRFDCARSYAVYDGALVRAIVMLKFERIEPLGAWFADRLAEVVRREAETLAVDIVVPVPLHRERERERGYNQADLIAKPLAKRPGAALSGGFADADAAPA